MSEQSGVATALRLGIICTRARKLRLPSSPTPKRLLTMAGLHGSRRGGSIGKAPCRHSVFALNAQVSLTVLKDAGVWRFGSWEAHDGTLIPPPPLAAARISFGSPLAAADFFRAVHALGPVRMRRLFDLIESSKRPRLRG